MPVIGAILGAVAMGLVYWVMWGGGLSYIDAMLNARQDRRRREESTRRRLEAGEEAARAPLRTLSDPREAATVLMCAAGLTRGELTPEQIAAVTDVMRDVLGFGADLDAKLSYCRFAAEKAGPPESTVDEVAPRLRGALTPAEQDKLRAMLDRVVAVHGGPTERQERFVSLAMRRVGEAR